MTYTLHSMSDLDRQKAIRDKAVLILLPRIKQYIASLSVPEPMGTFEDPGRS